MPSRKTVLHSIPLVTLPCFYFPYPFLYLLRPFNKVSLCRWRYIVWLRVTGYEVLTETGTPNTTLTLTWYKNLRK